MNERTPDMEHHDLRGRVDSLEHGAAHKESRLVALEQWRAQMDIANAVRDQQFLGIQADLKSIKANLTWIVRLIIGGIIMGMIAFLLSGGFRAP